MRITNAVQTFEINEKYLSQIPALGQLINLGYRYLTPEQALAKRGGRVANVLLENILRGQLAKINRIRFKGSEYPFSEENIQSAIQKIKEVRYDGLQKTNEEIYDLITLGTALEQTIEGDSKSFTLNYIDWENPAANVFHVAAEFSVERARSTQTARPDAEYAKTFAIALSSEKFIMQTDKDDLQRYQNDFKRFQKLKMSVQLRYAETVDYRDYEPRIKKLLDTHIQADEVTRLNDPVNILDEATFQQVKDGQGIYQKKTPAARADMIAHTIKKQIRENLEQDPVFYQRFSELIQKAIDDFREQRTSDAEYLQRATSIHDQLKNRRRDDVPGELRGDDEACAYFGAVKSCLTEMGVNSLLDDIATSTARAVQSAITNHWKVDFWNDSNALNAVKNEIDDFFYDDLKDKRGIDLPPEKMDEITARTMKIAKFHRRS